MFMRFLYEGITPMTSVTRIRANDIIPNGIVRKEQPLFAEDEGDLYTSVELITPAKAKAYFAANAKNRKVRQGNVDKYAKDMMAGKWKLTHQGICFYADGTLADGQHRLLAIIKAGFPVKMNVTRGLDKNAGTTLDIGGVRNDVDLSLAMGVDFGLTPQMVACSNAMRVTHRREQETVQDRLGFAVAHLDAIKFAVASCKTGVAKIAMVRGVVARAWYTADRDHLARFGDVVSTGRGEGPHDDAAIILRNLVIRDPGISSGYANRTTLNLKVQSALRSFLDGRSISRLFEAKAPIFLLPEEVA